ncbi:MAG: anthranilate synthase component [Abditibacteriota bacterium]|nr:anthranilate synthase component [Abditibacteriota bacterium]
MLEGNNSSSQNASLLTRDDQGIAPDFATFSDLARPGCLVPVWCEVLADLETPVSAFLKLRGDSQNGASDGDAWLLESVEGGENVARHSFLGVSSRGTLKTRGREVWLRDGDQEQHFQLPEGRDPLHIVEEWMHRYEWVDMPGLPQFCGGAVGFLGYDLVRFFERLPDAPTDDRDIADCHLLLTDTLLVFDSVRHTIKVLCNAPIDDASPAGVRAAYDLACDKIEDALARLQTTGQASSLLPIGRQIEEADPQSNFPSREAFEDAVRKVIEYIHAGDCVQVVPSQRFAVPMQADSFEVYRALRHVSPAPYMFYLSLDDVQLIGSSPEILVTERNGLVRTRPLAGTRRRGQTEAEDAALEAELLADPKERAEHIMLVDLGRNDLGRVCEYGSVKVNEMMVIERYSHVMHIASDVTGTLRQDKTQFDVLRAAFPAGTLSGAPKVRAMQIIDELEPTRRGPYGGAIGYFGFNGNLDTAITLRTIIAKDGMAYVQAGAGVVADSDPAAEWEETCNKARAALRAIALAEHHRL